jgi:methionyl-tRNA synthetase
MNKFYITTTLPYVNSRPHIGFALEIVQADVIARNHRSLGDDVFFNTGADEHGVKIYRKAEEKGLSPQEFCDINANEFKKLKEALNLSYDNFIRTTDPEHIKAAQEFWKRCDKKGDIYKKNYKVKYCSGCEMEKTESELVDGKCPLHPNQELEIIEEENYFFRYSKYQEELSKLYKNNPDFVVPKSRLGEIKEFNKKGLKDFSISRLKEKMSWGIPVPGDESQVMYVWFDALVNYISCLGWPKDTENFNAFWPGMQIAGKDNLRQQSSMWQAMLMSAGLKPSSCIFIHGFITSNNQKMSKSLGNVIDPFEAVKKYGTDAVRYFLLREISPTEDGDFTYDKFESRYNSDLAKGLGNLISRVTNMAKDMSFDSFKADPEIKEKIEETKNNSEKSLSEFKFNESLSQIWELISFCDRLIEKERPWEDSENKKQIIFNLLFLIKNIASLIFPFLPSTSEKIKEIIGDNGNNSFKAEKREPLFPRI